jgi:hypothetical protein
LSLSATHDSIQALASVASKVSARITVIEST